MNTLSESLNFSKNEAKNSHKIKVSETEHIAAYDTLCLICAELDIDTNKYDDSDFSSTSMHLEDAYEAAQDDIKTINESHVDLYFWID
jgi:hypothetical protein